MAEEDCTNPPEDILIWLENKYPTCDWRVLTKDEVEAALKKTDPTMLLEWKAILSNPSEEAPLIPIEWRAGVSDEDNKD